MRKLKIKKTGEIVDVVNFGCGTNRSKADKVSYIDSKGVEHVDEPLNYYWDFEEISSLDDSIDWEQRRYEIAKDVLITLIAYPTRTHNNFYEEAINFADNLIEKLKEK